METQPTDPHQPDPLLSLRRALSSSSSTTSGTTPSPNQPVLLTSPTPTPTNTTTDLTVATHLHLPATSQCIPLSTPTRFISAAAGNIPIDLRSIYFAWLKRDVAIPEYIASAQAVNEGIGERWGKEGKEGKEGAVGKVGKVLHLVFVERLDLITWLEGASEDSEYIRPLAGDVGVGDAGVGAATRAAEDSAKVASGAAGGVSTIPSAGSGAQGAGAGAGAGAGVGVGVGGRPVRSVDPRLQEIYNGERKMGDRNSVLRGIKPTDFSHVRKTAEMFLGRNRSRPGPTRTANMAKPGHETHLNIPIQRRVPNQTTGTPLLHKPILLPASKPHHPPLPLRLLPPAHVKHQILPPGRHLRATRPPNPRHLHRLQPPPHHPHPSDPPGPNLQLQTLLHPRLHTRRLRPPQQPQTHPLHPRRQHRRLQAGLLEPRRRRLHHGPDVAVQIVQVVLAAGAVQACHGHLCRVARGGCAEGS
ncbi:pol II transcription elongation factor subunit Cdc73 [Blastomyces dermatitidis ER-3]|uniref:Pol II transcription elongation factor subunit Cdc73 n=1 Tax=Ajellomyces dermatitidis (strain ER-3 / ATCC MYA-2586) TaxID=559297 RepID=A0ABP2EUQ9_AJEDR|nr:pol II transcription elongation factor subunit Cdc73 [Blastomyces dermatitidis ER-3]EEQ85542.2 pol II transcription elongation factor subunit Cdc73 [Blastomyces dermatitidis ER-3]